MAGQGEHRLAAHRARLAFDQLIDQPRGLLDRPGPVERAGRFVKGGPGLVTERSSLGLGRLRARMPRHQIVKLTGEPDQLGPLISDPVQRRLIGAIGRGGFSDLGRLTGGPGFVFGAGQAAFDRLSSLLGLGVGPIRFFDAGFQEPQLFAPPGQALVLADQAPARLGVRALGRVSLSLPGPGPGFVGLLRRGPVGFGGRLQLGVERPGVVGHPDSGSGRQHLPQALRFGQGLGQVRPDSGQPVDQLLQLGLGLAGRLGDGRQPGDVLIGRRLRLKPGLEDLPLVPAGGRPLPGLGAHAGVDVEAEELAQHLLAVPGLVM